MKFARDSKKLLAWYLKEKRALPWRTNCDPYLIWISEVMLQQTTVRAVIPYYEKFCKRFPDIKTLAKAPLREVLATWSGLGYYSRARNLHLAAQNLARTGFPRTSRELLLLPGFGPYTSRAVASIAFDENVGVLDGNVIRVLSRKFQIAQEWWLPAVRKVFQELADEMVKGVSAREMNQALMELGATICTPQKPSCSLCPWSTTCQAFKNRKVQVLPLTRPKRKFEIWHYQPILLRRGQKICLVLNQSLPFLKKQWLFPGEAKKLAKKPDHFDFQHTITHHKIFIALKRKKVNRKKTSPPRPSKWIDVKDLSKMSPSVMLSKILSHVQGP